MENGSKMLKKTEETAWGERVFFYLFLSSRSQMQMKEVSLQKEGVVKTRELFYHFKWVLNSLENL